MTEGYTDISSDSVISISIIKHLLTTNATEMNIILSYDISIDDKSIRHILDKISIEYNKYKDIEKQYMLILPIEEISHIESDEYTISERYKYILYNKEDITTKYNQIPNDIHRYNHIVLSLCVEYLKLKGIRNTDKHTNVKKILSHVSLSYSHAFDPSLIYDAIVH